MINEPSVGWVFRPDLGSRTQTRGADQVGFVVLPRRWCVERTFSWINRCRRTVRDYERLPEHHTATVYWAMIIIMGRRLAQHHTAGRVIPQHALIRLRNSGQVLWPDLVRQPGFVT